MQIIKGKKYLIDFINDLASNTIFETFFMHGVFDIELVRSLEYNLYNENKKTDLRIILSNLHGKSAIRASEVVNNYGQVRTSIKCRSKFLIINNYLFFFSGNWADTNHSISDDDIVIFSSAENEAYILENIFYEDWKHGVNLHI